MKKILTNPRPLDLMQQLMAFNSDSKITEVEVIFTQLVFNPHDAFAYHDVFEFFSEMNIKAIFYAGTSTTGTLLALAGLPAHKRFAIKHTTFYFGDCTWYAFDNFNDLKVRVEADKKLMERIKSTILGAYNLGEERYEELRLKKGYLDISELGDSIGLWTGK